MDNESAFTQPIYLLKVLSGLAILAAVILAAVWLPDSGASAQQQQWGVAALLVAAVALVPVVQWGYRRMDELHRLMHQQASVLSLSIVASAWGLVGILQAHQLVPLFNQFWGLGLVVVVWGLNLMLADRCFK